jgi:molecular chaperone IbpA
MTTFDLTPLYRTAIGFDRMADMLSTASRAETNGYPPYNIESLGEDRYRITMAVAGFSQDELDIVTERNTLTVSGAKKDAGSNEEGEFLYRGIGNRSFERRFQLADHVEVDGAGLENGLLHIELKRELPEQMKARKIEIGSGKSRLIEGERDKKEKAKAA